MNKDKIRAQIGSILAEIEGHHAALMARGIDARHPDDREAFDAVCRIERKALAATAEPRREIESPHQT